MLGLLPWEVEALLAAMECEQGEQEQDIEQQPTLLLPAMPVAQAARSVPSVGAERAVGASRTRTKVLPTVRFQRNVEAALKRSRQFIAPYRPRLEKEVVR